MSINIYGQPIAWMVVEILLVPLLWGILTWTLSGKRTWECAINFVLLLAAIYMVLYSTLLSRTADARSSTLYLPFQLLLAAIKENREIVRSLLLNVLLFAPLGAGLANCLPQRLSLGWRLLITTLAGLAVSLAVEYGQYRFSLGNAEADDVICNTFGALIGGLSLPIKEFLKKGKADKSPCSPSLD